MENNKALVALRRCETYENESVQQAIDDLFDLCGGVGRFVCPGDRVLIKVNLLMKRTPDRATTTHPAVARAIVRAVQKAGGEAILCDSPGGPYTRGMLAGVYETCGMKAVAEETGCALNDDFSVMERILPDGVAARKLDLLGVLDKVDKVITVGKLKTHGLTTMTGCVKNLFGVIPGTVKVEYHARYQDVGLFSDMLLDICSAVKPCFAILDAVEGMEGEGPSGGKPRLIGALLGGENPHAVDVAGARLIGLEPGQVTTLEAAKRHGVLPEIELAGDDLLPLIQTDFDIPMKQKSSSLVRLVNALPQFLRPRPVFTHRKCDGCGVCMRSCPAKAITMNEKRRPQVDLSACIRCYCCQELCPKTDIEVKRNRIIAWLK